MDPSEVLFSARKYDGSLHWHCTMFRLGEDDHGVWLGMPAGTVHSKGDAGPVYESNEARVKPTKSATPTRPMSSRRPRHLPNGSSQPYARVQSLSTATSVPG
ncbi:hypothetical protein AB0N93_15900 [Streptomyces sp. NPDC091267]|uniref:hypothetical protein n=1 Tax=Streptomyces sp. NPDC091267 TaxID=3155195 RepID=UPI00344931D5